MLHGIGTEVQVIAPCPAYGMYGVIIGYGDGADYQVDMDAVERNCFDHAECIAGWNGSSLRRVSGGDGHDDVLPAPVDPGATIPLTDEVGLAA
ncbi:hypothetical protein K2224_14550 [Streptomyces sp. BHT-5-2]|uniref:hypothetical protein n=1 Tax=Streptomyces sp. BHT-5-2 TaxID=2866715 RepID=UPI001C8EFEDD|nr:hypothetical protein [Streptomyces sp. BHT-5-2]QZL04255.1 hypothetical protein K2224_14550 [Streptomyces sp. BHT-5-2]